MTHPARINCNANKSAYDLVDQSEDSGEIVHAPYSEVVAAGLFLECDGSASGEGVEEYWTDGWRVHLHH